MNDLDRLFTAWLSGPLVPGDAEALRGLLQDPVQRRRWRALADLEGALAERGATIGASPAHASPISTRRLAVQPPRSRWRRWVGLAIAAGLLLAGGAVWWPQRHATDERPRLAGRPLEPGEAIVGPATLVWLDGSQAQFWADARGRVSSTGVGLDLDMGRLELRLAAPAAGRDVVVSSAQAVIRARDARFSLLCDGEATSVVVDGGTATFTPRGGAERTLSGAATALAGQATAPPAGLVGWWPLEEGSGTTAQDRSGQGHDGRIVGPRWTGDGLRFAGGDERVDILPRGALAALQDGDYTVAAWYRPDALPPPGEISDPARSQDALGVIVGRTGWTLGLHVDPAGRFFMEHFLSDRSAMLARTPPLAAVGTWCHLAGIVDRTHGETRIAVDGVIRGRMRWKTGLPTCRYLPTQLWRIGIGDPGNPRFRWPATGLIRGVRMYARALDDHDLLRLAGTR